MTDELAQILAEYQGEHGALIPILQKVQEKYGYLPANALPEIAKVTRISESEIFGVASFYACHLSEIYAYQHSLTKEFKA